MQRGRAHLFVAFGRLHSERSGRAEQRAAPEREDGRPESFQHRADGVQCTDVKRGQDLRAVHRRKRLRGGDERSYRIDAVPQDAANEHAVPFVQRSDPCRDNRGAG